MNDLYRFGEFRLDPDRRVLLRRDETVALAPKSFDLLLVLIENRSRVLTKDELLKAVWPDTFVEEGNLKFNVSVIRKVLGDDSWIETLPRRGYRFAGHVEEVSGQASQADEARVELAAVEVKDRTEVSVSLEAELNPAARLWRIAALAVVLIGASMWAWWRLRSDVEVRSMAVLPFQSITKGSDQEMELGLTDSLIARLGSEGKWTVRPTGAVRQYAGVERDPLSAGRTLGVDAVLDGSIQRSEDKLRVTLQLLRVSDGRHLWTGKFENKLTDLFTMEDQVAGQVSQALHANLQRRGSRSVPRSTEVLQLYLAGRHFFNEEKAPTRQAVQNFELAIEKDPNFAPAYGMLALSYWQLSQRGVAPSREVRDKMRAAAQKAIELDESSAEGHVAMAFVKMWLEFDWVGAQQQHRRALELNPNEPLAYVAWGMNAIANGRFDETEKAYRKKLEIDPRSLMSTVGMGYPLLYAKRYDEALEWYKKALAMDPNFAVAYTDMAMAYNMKGMYRESVQASLKAAALSGTDPARLAERLAIFEKGGMDAYRRDNLESLLSRSRRGQNVSPLTIAAVYSSMGEREKALDWLEKAVEERTFPVLFLKTFPPWSKLAGEPRYHALLRTMHLE